MIVYLKKFIILYYNEAKIIQRSKCKSVKVIMNIQNKIIKLNAIYPPPSTCPENFITELGN